MTKRKDSISSLKKKADQVFSKWVRAREPYCVTCGSRNNLQAGHYVSRSWNALRYSEVNVHTQCSGCNIFKRGNMDEYARFLIKKYGPGILNQLAKKKVVHQFTRSELETLISKYK